MQTVLSQEQALIQDAIAGDKAARGRVSALSDPIIRWQNERFCRRFCKENRFRYRCSLSKPLSGAPSNAALCEWGNGGYAWMLDDLTHNRRLATFTGEGGATLYDYLATIANSLPFYERWKDWRFGRRIYVPTYVQALGDEAKSIFYALRQGDPLALIAQNLGLALARVEELSQAIVIKLTEHQRLYLLQPVTLRSLCETTADEQFQAGEEMDLADPAPGPEQLLESAQFKLAWQRLDAVEQYVLEALLIDNLDANDVLVALQQLDIAIHPKTAAADTDRQQLYYFKRKALVKLKSFLNLD